MYPRFLKCLQIAEAYRAFSDAGYRPFNDIFKPLTPQKQPFVENAKKLRF
jgi:hypothetical protein